MKSSQAFTHCLRFGHIQKYCRNNLKCNHCGKAKHTLNTCPFIQISEPVCLFSKLLYLSTDRSCRERIAQNEIKKIIAIENISYQKYLILTKNNFHISAFKYSDFVDSQPPISDIIKPKISFCGNNFTSLNENHHIFNSKKTKHKSRLSTTKTFFYR